MRCGYPKGKHGFPEMRYGLLKGSLGLQEMRHGLTEGRYGLREMRLGFPKGRAAFHEGRPAFLEMRRVFLAEKCVKEVKNNQLTNKTSKPLISFKSSLDQRMHTAELRFL
jgi:hypothetical protein